MYPSSFSLYYRTFLFSHYLVEGIASHSNGSLWLRKSCRNRLLCSAALAIAAFPHKTKSSKQKWVRHLTHGMTASSTGSNPNAFATSKYACWRESSSPVIRQCTPASVQSAMTLSLSIACICTHRSNANSRASRVLYNSISWFLGHGFSVSTFSGIQQSAQCRMRLGIQLLSWLWTDDQTGHQQGFSNAHASFSNLFPTTVCIILTKSSKHLRVLLPIGQKTTVERPLSPAFHECVSDAGRNPKNHSSNMPWVHPDLLPEALFDDWPQSLSILLISQRMKHR